MLNTRAFPSCAALNIADNGEGGIRTLGSRKATTVFETAPINHSWHSPTGRHPLYSNSTGIVTYEMDVGEILWT